MTEDRMLVQGLCVSIDSALLEEKAPLSKVDIMPLKGEGVAVQMALTPERVTRWLDGAPGKYECTFTVIVQVAPTGVAKGIGWLQKAKDAFYDADHLHTGERIVSVDATEPSKIGVMQSGDVRYSVTITIDYYER